MIPSAEPKLIASCPRCRRCAAAGAGGVRGQEAAAGDRQRVPRQRLRRRIVDEDQRVDRQVAEPGGDGRGRRELDVGGRGGLRQVRHVIGERADPGAAVGGEVARGVAGAQADDGVGQDPVRQCGGRLEEDLVERRADRRVHADEVQRLAPRAPASRLGLVSDRLEALARVLSVIVIDRVAAGQHDRSHRLGRAVEMLFCAGDAVERSLAVTAQATAVEERQRRPWSRGDCRGCNCWRWCRSAASVPP